MLRPQTGEVLEERVSFQHEAKDFEEARLFWIRVPFAHELQAENSLTPKMLCLDLQPAIPSWQEPTSFRYLMVFLYLE